MVMSIKEEITALEEQLENTKGPGSVAKKKDIQAKIDALKEQDKPAGDEPPEEEKKEKKKDEKEEESPPAVSRPGPIEEAKLEKFPGRILPPGKEWLPVTLKQVQEAEKEGTLQGFDPDKMIALIRGK